VPIVEPRKATWAINGPLRTARGSYPGQLQAHADDSVPAREHHGRDLPTSPCEFQILVLALNDRPLPLRDLGH
jgi:hypothetical protein